MRELSKEIVLAASLMTAGIFAVVVVAYLATGADTLVGPAVTALALLGVWAASFGAGYLMRGGD